MRSTAPRSQHGDAPTIHRDVVRERGDAPGPLMALVQQLVKMGRSLRWLPAYAWQRAVRRPTRHKPIHLIMALADHFEPAIVPENAGRFASLDVQERRLEAWCHEYPRAVDRWRDADGKAFRHTYFYPAEQYEPGLIDRLAEHCRQGWGEVEIHLHHGVDAPDTPGNTRHALVSFRDQLVQRGCLSRWDSTGKPRYAFVHGNWALANSAGGRFCGVDEEMRILAETGCYADLTLPSMPSPAQIAKINALYECALPLGARAPHRRGVNLRCGRPPRTFPLIVQGPLQLTLVRSGRKFPAVRIDNGALDGVSPPTMARLRRWVRASIIVEGQPDWVFVKLHCHGMDPRDTEALRGLQMQRFLEELTCGAGREYRVHFVTAREMVNIMLAACDSRQGSPGQYRDYRLKLIQPTTSPTVPYDRCGAMSR